MTNPTFIYVVYGIDCFTVWFSRALSSRQIAHLRMLNHPQPVEHKEGPMYGKGNEVWVHKLKISAPNASVFAYLNELAINRDYLINYEELCADFMTPDKVNARHMASYINQRIVRHWSRNRKVICSDAKGNETVYTDPRKSKQNVDAYVRESKFTGEPCCHVEIRIKGKKDVQNNGVITFDDLQNLDIEQLIFKKVAFLELDTDKLHLLGKRFLPKGTPHFSKRCGRHGWRFDKHRRAAHIVLRACLTHGGHLDLQKLKQKINHRPGSNPQRLFRKIDIRSLQSS